MNLGNLQLAVGDTSLSITVKAEPPMVESTKAQKSFVISSEQVSELSLNGRDFGSLILTLPGVTTDGRFRAAAAPGPSPLPSGGRYPRT